MVKPHIYEPVGNCLAKRALISWSVKKANSCQKVLQSLGSYTWVFTVWPKCHKHNPKISPTV